MDASALRARLGAILDVLHASPEGERERALRVRAYDLRRAAGGDGYEPSAFPRPLDEAGVERALTWCGQELDALAAHARKRGR